MSSSQNYYGVLQVQPDADLDTIKRAYRNKIRRYHPDQFAANLSHMKRSGTLSDVRQLEREIAQAQQMTQRINEAYAVLSDEQARATYDQFLSDERQRKYYQDMRRQRMQHYEGERRTVKSRPHHQRPGAAQRPPKDGIPWVILVGLVVLLLFVSALFSNAVTRNHTPFTTYVPRNPTSAGSMLAADLQATTSAQQETAIARTTLVFQPTPTALSASENERLGDRLMTFGQVEQAIEAYHQAIANDYENATLHFKRASAYAILAREDAETINMDYVEAALNDYDNAIGLDETYADAYLGRGLLYYDLWRIHNDYGANARADLEQYLAISTAPDRDTVETLLADLLAESDD